MSRKFEEPETAPNQGEIQAFAERSSDFYFEISVLRELVRLGWRVTHGGTYEDPITKKTREYDLRCSKPSWSSGRTQATILLAVECKNFTETTPLLFHCVPRGRRESLVEGVYSHCTARPSDDRLAAASFLSSKSTRSIGIPLWGPDSLYQQGGLSAKSFQQFKRSTSGPDVGTEKAFDKISQAVHSAHGLFKQGHYAGDNEAAAFTLVIPILVVPDERIWTIEYHPASGDKKPPERRTKIPYFIDRQFLLGNSEHEWLTRAGASHLEVCELGALPGLLEELTKYSHRIQAMESDFFHWDGRVERLSWD